MLGGRGAPMPVPPTCLPVSLLGVSSSQPQRSYDSSMRSARRTRCSMRAACAPAAAARASITMLLRCGTGQPIHTGYFDSLPASALSLQVACGDSADAKPGRMH